MSLKIEDGPHPVTDVLVGGKFGPRDTEEEHQVKTDWTDAPTSQRMLRIASNHQKLGKRHRTGSPSEPQTPCQGFWT